MTRLQETERECVVIRPPKDKAKDNDHDIYDLLVIRTEHRARAREKYDCIHISTTHDLPIHIEKIRIYVCMLSIP